MAFQEGFNPFGGINKSSGSGSDSGGGAGGGVMTVTAESDGLNSVLSANYSQLDEALTSGMCVQLLEEDQLSGNKDVKYLTRLQANNNSYKAYFGNNYYFTSNNDTDPLAHSGLD